MFGRFITDFGRVVAQMQYNMYHVYTVDEHTIRAIGLLHAVEQGKLKAEHPLSSELVHRLLSRLLYLALLLHDIAKGRGGDHSTLGAEVARKLCPRLGLTPEETDTVAWLVRYHLAMSHTAQKRDIGDRKTITDFAGLVQSPERLRLLLVLTVVDMKATGPKVFNNWKAALLRDLYFKTEEVLTGALATHGDAARVRGVLAELRAALAEWSEADWQAHVARGQAAYWLALDIDTLARHARIIRQAGQSEAPCQRCHLRTCPHRAHLGHEGSLTARPRWLGVCGCTRPTPYRGPSRTRPTPYRGPSRTRPTPHRGPSRTRPAPQSAPSSTWRLSCSLLMPVGKDFEGAGSGTPGARDTLRTGRHGCGSCRRPTRSGPSRRIGSTRTGRVSWGG